jgi:hypothetical protein
MSLVTGNLSFRCTHCDKINNVTIGNVNKNENSTINIEKENKTNTYTTTQVITLCDPIVHIRLNNPECSDALRVSPLPVCVILNHDGFWITKDGKHQSTTDITCNSKSVILSPKCMLYVYKLALRHLLLSMKMISPCDLDSQNIVPHVVVRKNNHDSNSYYDVIQGEKFSIGESSISAKKDFLIIEIDRVRNLHTTLIYSKNIGSRVNLLAAFKSVVILLNKYPYLAEYYSNLPYFGESENQYWYDTPSSFPFGINKSKDAS